MPITIEKRDRLKLPAIPPPKRPAPERIADFCEVTLAFTAELAMAEASRCVECARPPCVVACPLSNPIKDWLVLTAEGRFLEAGHLAQRTNPLPEVCGRICPQDRLCEGACIAGKKHPPVAIGAVERFITEYAVAHEGFADPGTIPSTGFRIGIVGSGPAGLACAADLATRGHHVTVYEAMPEAGGLLRYGIPGFKLEKAAVDRRIAYLEDLGVEFIANTRVGEDISLSEMQGYFHAVYLAPGATTSKRPTLPGIGLEGVIEPLPFLIRNSVDPPPFGERDDLRGKEVVVLGGGDTAMDCLRTARRLGARSVTCVYRRDEANMPGSRREVQAAKDEGVDFQWLTAPIRFHDEGTGRLRAVECVRMTLGEPDAQGRRRPIPLDGSNIVIPADIAILAFGFDGTPIPTSKGGPALKQDGTYVVDDAGETSILGVFAGGDAIRGPDLVVTALRDGRRAAETIHRYLLGDSDEG